MELELLMRREGAISPEIQEEITQAKIVDGENFSLDKYLTDNDLYEYDPVTVDVFSVSPYNRFDEKHTTLYLDNGLCFIAKIPYEQFQRIKTAMTGQNVKTITDFHLKKQK